MSARPPVVKIHGTEIVIAGIGLAGWLRTDLNSIKRRVAIKAITAGPAEYRAGYEDGVRDTEECLDKQRSCGE